MQDVAIYSDFSDLARLRFAARSDAAANLEEAAGQFESLFLQMMLQSMRQATEKGGLFDSHQLDSYQSMYDQQLALELSTQGGIGIASAIVEQLETWDATAVSGKAAAPNKGHRMNTAEYGERSLELYRTLSRVIDNPGSSDHTALDIEQDLDGAVGD